VFDQSLRALAPFGRLATFGMAGRVAPTPIEPRTLMARSTSVVGFWLAHLMHRPELLAAAITDLLALIAAEAVRPVLGGSFPLEQAADAHRALRSRGTVGKLVLAVAGPDAPSR
jgi:NADPH2:quinone reductase